MTLPNTMTAMVTTGHGDLDKIVEYNDWPRPTPAAGEVLIRVAACGLNNTDVNTRSGWYSKMVTEATTGTGFEKVGEADPTWGGVPIEFPRIQGQMCVVKLLLLAMVLMRLVWVSALSLITGCVILRTQKI